MRLPFRTVLFILLVSLTASCTSPQERLCDVDAGLKADSARRDYILETDRRAKMQGLSGIDGTWEEDGRRTTLGYRRRPSAEKFTKAITLNSAEYSKESGITCVVQGAARVQDGYKRTPLALFNVYDKYNRLHPASRFFERMKGLTVTVLHKAACRDDPDGSREGICETTLILPVTFKRKEDLSGLKIELIPTRIVPAVSYSVTGRAGIGRRNN